MLDKVELVMPATWFLIASNLTIIIFDVFILSSKGIFFTEDAATLNCHQITTLVVKISIEREERRGRLRQSQPILAG